MLTPTEYLQRIASSIEMFHTMQGHRFEAANSWTLTATGIIYTLIITGDTPCIGERDLGWNGVGGVYKVFKNPTVTMVQSPVKQAVFNLNPGSGYVNKFSMYDTTQFTVTNEGTKAFSNLFFGGATTDASKGGNLARFGEPRVLEANTTYLLSVTSRDTTDQTVLSRIILQESELYI